MIARFLSFGLACGLTVASAAWAEQPAKSQGHRGMSQDMRRAIAFQHQKDEADRRQARLEAIHPSVEYNNQSADRSADRMDDGHRAKDPGEKQVQEQREK